MPDPMSPAPIRPEIAALETSGIAQLFALGPGRDDLIALWVGEGDLPTPGFICEAAARALRDGKTFYTAKRGIPELRSEIAAYLRGLFGVALEAERVTVTSSGMSGIMQVMQTLAGPGGNVVVVTPVWPNVLGAVQIAGGTVKPVGLDSRADGFHLDLERLFAACDRDTRAVFVVSPSNPTGWIMGAEDQAALLEFCRARGIWIVADEVYHRFVYGLPAGEAPHAPSFLELIEPEDPVIVVNSFSKNWAMTGWRLGWLTHPVSLAANFDRLIEYNTSGAPGFLQEGCLAALRDGEPFVREMVARCRRGRDLVHQGLSALPRVRLASPPGAFYAFFAVEGLEDSLAFAKEILARTGVGLAPGSAFGPGGEGHLRLCFASGTERLSEALERLQTVLR